MDNLKIERSVDGRTNQIDVQQQVVNGATERVVIHKEIISNGTIGDVPVIIDQNENLTSLTPVEDDYLKKSDVESLFKKYLPQQPKGLSRSEIENLIKEYAKPTTAEPKPVVTESVAWDKIKEKAVEISSYVLITALAVEVGWVVWAAFIR